MSRLAAAVAAALTAGALLAGLVAAEEPSAGALERMWSISDRLDCPVCQGQSVRESNAELARQMRDLILAKVKAGESDPQIFAFFQERYGAGILRDPPKQGFALGAWIGAAVGVAVAALAVALVLAGGRRQPTPALPADLGRYEGLLDELRRPPDQPDSAP